MNSLGPFVVAAQLTSPSQVIVDIEKLFGGTPTPQDLICIAILGGHISDHPVVAKWTTPEIGLARITCEEGVRARLSDKALNPNEVTQENYTSGPMLETVKAFRAQTFMKDVSAAMEMLPLLDAHCGVARGLAADIKAVDPGYIPAPLKACEPGWAQGRLMAVADMDPDAFMFHDHSKAPFGVKQIEREIRQLEAINERRKAELKIKRELAAIQVENDRMVQERWAEDVAEKRAHLVLIAEHLDHCRVGLDPMMEIWGELTADKQDDFTKRHGGSPFEELQQKIARQSEISADAATWSDDDSRWKDLVADTEGWKRRCSTIHGAFGDMILRDLEGLRG